MKLELRIKLREKFPSLPPLAEAKIEGTDLLLFELISFILTEADKKKTDEAYKEWLEME
jgi:hypothetical protein